MSDVPEPATQRVWVDFNDVHDGEVTTLVRFADAPAHLRVGGSLVAYDDDLRLPAVVTALDGDLVTLLLHARQP